VTVVHVVTVRLGLGLAEVAAVGDVVSGTSGPGA
jgi:hypothetical protein